LLSGVIAVFDVTEPNLFVANTCHNDFCIYLLLVQLSQNTKSKQAEPSATSIVWFVDVRFVALTGCICQFLDCA